MEGRVELLTRNMRYRIVNIGNEYYILDMEKTIWMIFIPFLIWFMPQKVYKIDRKTADNLRSPVSSSDNSSSIAWIGAGGAAILSPLLKPLLDYTLESRVLVNLLLLIGTAAFIIFLRLYLRNALQNRLSKKVDSGQLDVVWMKIRPKYFRQYSDPVLSFLFIGALLLIPIYGFVDTSSIILLVTFIVLLLLALILSSIVIYPLFGKTNLYKVSLTS